MNPVKTLFFVWLVCCSLLACGSPSSVLPTLMPTAGVPLTRTSIPSPTSPSTEREVTLTEVSPTHTPIPGPTPTYSVHTSFDSLVRLVVGVKLRQLTIDSYESDGLVGYDVDIVVHSPQDLTRLEMLEMAYDLTREYYYNYTNTPSTFITLHLRAGTRDDPPDLLNCSFGLGIGYESVSQYLPSNRPENLESWYSRLVDAQYYGDLPGQTDAQLAYGNDPKSQTFCGVEEWR